MQSVSLKVWLNPFYGGTERFNLKIGSFFIRLMGMAIGSAGFMICLTLGYHAMRGILKLGGVVAGGQQPHPVIHRAPDWVWIFPVAFIGGAIFIFINNFSAKRIGGLNLLILMWPAVFISFGYNFLDFAYHPPNKQPQVVIGWLICGIIFMLMGGVPLLAILKNTFTILRKRKTRRALLEQGRRYFEDREESCLAPGLVAFVDFIFCLGSLAGGVYLGIIIFQKLAG